MYICFFMARQPLVGQGHFHFRGFTITLRHTTLGTTSLDEWSTRHKDFCRTTHITHKRTFGYYSLQTYTIVNGSVVWIKSVLLSPLCSLLLCNVLWYVSRPTLFVLDLQLCRAWRCVNARQIFDFVRLIFRARRTTLSL
jgi:hypothetical protein